MIDIAEARTWLRITHEDLDDEIRALLDAAVVYIEVTTGMTEEQQEAEPLAKTVSRFLLILWSDAGQENDWKIQRTVDNLLKALTVKARVYDS